MSARPRWLAWGLIVYGVLGIALVVSGASIGLGLAGRIEQLLRQYLSLGRAQHA